MPSSDFFIRLFQKGPRRYCKGVKSIVARDLFKIGTKYGEAPQGISFGLSPTFVNTIEETPASKKNLIVIPWMAEKDFEYETTAYDKSAFDADVVDYKISQEEFDAVVNDLKRSEYWIPQYTLPFNIWLGMLIVPTILMTLCFAIINHGYDNTHPIMYLIIVISCPLMAILNFLSPLFVYRANITRLENREKDFGTILTTWNHRVFNDRKVQWKIGKYGCWLEIHFDKELRNLESFNKEVLDNARSDLQLEYETEAKRLKINVDGQRIGIGAVGCTKAGVAAEYSKSAPNSRSGASIASTKVSDSAENRQVGHAIVVEDKEGNDDDDLEIKSISLGRPLLVNPDA